MALFNNFKPIQQSVARKRNFQASGLNKVGLAFSGKKENGQNNLWGDVVNDVLPTALAAISTYYLASPQIGYKAGDLINKGFDNISSGKFAGTEQAAINANSAAKDDVTRNTISSIGNIAGSIYSAAGGKTASSKSNQAGTAQENAILDKALQGVSNDSIQGYLSDNDSTFNIASALSSLNDLQGIKQNLSNSQFNAENLDPNSAYNKFFSTDQNFQTGSGLKDFSQTRSIPGLTGQTSSILGDIGGIKVLDDKKKQKGSLDSFFGYDGLNGFGGYQGDAYGSLNGFAKGGKTKKLRFLIGGKSIKTDMPDFKLYSDGDKTEDLWMIDKNDAKQAGLEDVLSSLAYGHMRYGENIFDQKSSLIQDGILASGLPEPEKKRLLGEHIYSELLTHDNTVSYAGGGKTKPKPKKSVSRYFMPQGNTADFIEARNLYNSWAQSKGLPTLSSQSFDDTTAQAFASFNADKTNGRKLQVESSPYIQDGIQRNMVSRIALSEFMPEIANLSVDKIAGYNKKGDAIYTNQVVPTIRDKASNKLLVANDDYFPTQVDSTIPNKPIVSSINGKEARSKAFKQQNLINNLSSLAEIGIGGLFASTPQPKYEPPQEYKNMVADIYGRKNQGLSAEQNAQLNQNLNQGYANGVGALRNIAGGGATQGAVLAGLGSLSNSYDQGVLNNSLLNINAQNQNRQTYQNTVLQDLNLNRSLFAQDQQNALETKQNGLAMIGQGTQDLYQQNLYNQAYGPSSLYNDLQEQQLAGAQKYNDLAALQTQLAVQQIQQQGGFTPSVDTRSALTLPKIPRY